MVVVCVVAMALAVLTEEPMSLSSVAACTTISGTAVSAVMSNLHKAHNQPGVPGWFRRARVSNSLL
ncbi:hypothetical protein I551_3446 [Mycobacterium ulcerans str. Harvey]|uniref:Secreted protein n=1 Tax=Mycobacterium ulcerans str. Harvey TaxID=1299332 RepID=A0ABN0QZI0_MYCUL|nr:hypothetical protein I551_3446 [Mycobacterium ulcerans str. Harvey]